MKESFVIRYLKGMVSPSKIVQTRSKLTWIQLIVIFFFLMALLLTPFSLRTNAQENQLKQALPNAMNAISESEMAKLSQMEIKDQKKYGSTFEFVHGKTLVASLNQKEWEQLDISHQQETDYQLAGYKNAVVFGPHWLLLTDQNGQGVKMRYPVKQVAPFKNPKDVKEFMSRNWFNNHRLTMQLMFLFVETTIIAALMLLIILGATAIFYMVYRHKLDSLHPLRDMVAVVLLSAGIPTMIASILGIVMKDPMFAIQVQVALWVLYIVLAFWKLAAPKVNVNQELKKMIWKGE